MRMWALLAIWFTGCSTTPGPERWEGTWYQRLSLVTQVDFDGQPVEYCLEQDTTLVLEPDSTFVLDDYMFPVVDCVDGYEPVTLIRSGTWIELIMDDENTPLLSFESTHLSIVAERPKDSAEIDRVEQWTGTAAVEGEDSDRWLYISGMGMFSSTDRGAAP